jgi:hypothetical protein
MIARRLLASILYIVALVGIFYIAVTFGEWIIE